MIFAGKEARRRGGLARSRGDDGGVESKVGAKVVRMIYGVIPVDELSVSTEMSGPGSENRTRFLALVGVCTVSTASRTVCAIEAFLTLVDEAGGGLERPVLALLLRRTAIGLSSSISSCIICFLRSG